MEVNYCSFCEIELSPHQLNDLKAVDEELSCDLRTVSIQVLSFQIHDGVCCDDCKKDLIEAYKFKSKVLKVRQGFSQDVHSDIVRKLSCFLNSLESLENLTVMECSKSLAIVSTVDRLYMEHQGWQDFFDINSDLLVEMEETYSPVSIKEEKTFESFLQENFMEQHEEEEQDESDNDYDEDEVTNNDGNAENLQFENRQNSKPKKKWFCEFVKGCKSVKETENEEITIWTCLFCTKAPLIFTTRSGLCHHLHKFHSKAMHELSKNSEFSTESTNEEIDKNSPEYDWVMMMVDRSDLRDTRGLYQCCFCRNEMKTLAGIKLHILKTHCNANNDTLVYKRYEKDPVWINEMIDKSMTKNESDDNSKSDSKSEVLDSWTCCICNGVKSSSAHGIKLHIMKMHCKRENFEAPCTEKYERDPEWISETIEKSRTSEGVFSCTLCQNFTTKNRSGIHLHVVRMHCVSWPFVHPQSLSCNDEGEKHNKDREWIKEMIENSNPNNASEFWTCCICNTVKSNSAAGIKLHIIRIHCKKENSSEVVERHEKDPEWINSKIESSQTTENGSDSWKCSICNKFSTDSRHGIQLHIIRIHCVSINRPSLIELKASKECYSSDSSYDNTFDDDYSTDLKAKKLVQAKKWARTMTKKSERKFNSGKDSLWICKICKVVKSKSFHGMNLHIVRKHGKGGKKILSKQINFGGRPRNFKEPGNSKTILLKPKISISVANLDIKNVEGLTNLKTEKKDKTIMNENSVRPKINDRKVVHQWLKEILRNSRFQSEDGERWQCCLCQQPKSSYQTTRYHLVTSHVPSYFPGHVNKN